MFGVVIPVIGLLIVVLVGTCTLCKRKCFASAIFRPQEEAGTYGLDTVHETKFKGVDTSPQYYEERPMNHSTSLTSDSPQPEAPEEQPPYQPPYPPTVVAGGAPPPPQPRADVNTVSLDDARRRRDGEGFTRVAVRFRRRSRDEWTVSKLLLYLGLALIVPVFGIVIAAVLLIVYCTCKLLYMTVHYC